MCVSLPYSQLLPLRLSFEMLHHPTSSFNAHLRTHPALHLISPPSPTLTYSSMRSAPFSVLVQWITCLRALSLTAHDKNLTHYYSLCLIFSSLPLSCTHPHHFTAVASLGLSVICLAELKRAKLASHCLPCCEEDNEIFSSK